MKQLAFPIMLGLFILLMTGLFVFGDLGILAAYQKTQRVEQLQLELKSLLRIMERKHYQIERLEKDPATLRHYALLYGLSGGKQVKGTYHSEPLPHEDLVQLEQAGRGSFFLRHPMLLVLAFLISMLLFGFLLVNRRLQHKTLLEEQPIATTTRRNRHINPSWI